ncbi:MAG: T9SS type A sorting domain-containing protein, partial [Bacteroidetes bacterium]|nr:T9SS type A sorting domain-containing protein [Bacteroidota bacterium]
VSSGDGWRVYPALALRRNRLYVVWQHRLAEGTTPWMRVYELDQLLSSSSPPPPAAAALAVDGPWPQPASAQLQCIIQPPLGARLLHVAAFDALGRRLFFQEYDAVTTVPVTLDVRDWPDGIYMLRIRFDDTVKMLRFSVLH